MSIYVSIIIAITTNLLSTYIAKLIDKMISHFTHKENRPTAEK